jgi:heme exporter protein CcmD
MSLREFLAMGDYGGYIWSCYAVTVAMLIYSAWSARRSLREQIGAAKRRVEMQKEGA